MAKSTIMFSVRQNLPVQELHSVLSDVQQWHGVGSAGALFPGTKDLDLQRMGFVEVAESADPQVLLNKLASLASVDNASLAADRRLV